MSAARWISAVLLATALVAGAGFVLQRQSAAALQQEIALLREENRQLARLRAENERLRKAQPPAVVLERLRSDHAALLRLRAEIDEMRARADAAARNETPSR